MAVRDVIEVAQRDARQVSELLARVQAIDESMRPDAVAAQLGISRRYLQVLRKRAGLPPVKGGKRKQ